MELTAYSDIDLLDLRRASPVARHAGLAKCEPLFEDEPYVFTTEQLRAIQEYMGHRVAARA